MKIRVGQGFDVHRLVAGRPLFIGGVEIPYDRGLEGHSDGDVLLHAITDALLGALGSGDLGTRFPSSDTTLAGIASTALLVRVVADLREQGWVVSHLDATVIAEQPRLAAHQADMRAGIAASLGTDASAVNIKVTSTDGLGAIGRGEGIAAQAVVLLELAEASDA